MPRFTPQLVQETIDCFQEENGISLTPEQAEEYLAALAGLFMAFAEDAPGPDAYASGAGLLRAGQEKPEVLVTPRERSNLHHDRHD